MPSITALLYTSNSGSQLGRALETLYPCNEILIVDHQSTDETLRIAREYGARIVPSVAGVTPSHYLQFARSDWILCLAANESLTESLAASLYECKLSKKSESVVARGVLTREEAAKGWIDLPTPETRLIPRDWVHWQGRLPAHDPSAETLEGRLLRFTDRQS